MEHSNLVKKTLIVVENYRKGIQRNIDQFGATYSFCMDVPLSSSVEVFNALKAEGYNVSSRGESFGKVSLVIMFNNPNPPQENPYSNKATLLVSKIENPVRLRGKDFNGFIVEE